MTTLNRLIAFAFLLCPLVLLAGANDNEILLDQSGDTLTLTIDQVGYGNKHVVLFQVELVQPIGR